MQFFAVTIRASTLDDACFQLAAVSLAFRCRFELGALGILAAVSSLVSLDRNMSRGFEEVLKSCRHYSMTGGF